MDYAVAHDRGTAHEAISPELALVCPELRKRAIEALPDRDPDGFLPRPWQKQQKCEATPLDQLADIDRVVERPRHHAELVVAAASRIAVESAKTTAFGVITFAGVTGLVTLATVLPGA